MKKQINKKKFTVNTKTCRSLSRFAVRADSHQSH